MLSEIALLAPHDFFYIHLLSRTSLSSASSSSSVLCLCVILVGIIIVFFGLTLLLLRSSKKYKDIVRHNRKS